ncbi:hypothetical protein, partial [Luteimonas abyssi]
ATCFAELPVGVEVYTIAGLDAPMKIEKKDYQFYLYENDGSHSISGRRSNGKEIDHTIDDAGVGRVERIFAIDSQPCGTSSIDLVLQIAPSPSSESDRRNYYRIVFDSNLDNVVSEFYDPSIAAVNAILPLQSVEGTTDSETGRKIICNGSKPEIATED